MEVLINYLYGNNTPLLDKEIITSYFEITLNMSIVATFAKTNLITHQGK